jgi:hypothetical protein
MVVWFQIYFQPGKKEKEREGNQKIVLFVVITIISTVQNWVHSQVAEVAVEERHRCCRGTPAGQPTLICSVRGSSRPAMCAAFHFAVCVFLHDLSICVAADKRFHACIVWSPVIMAMAMAMETETETEMQAHY